MTAVRPRLLLALLLLLPCAHALAHPPQTPAIWIDARMRDGEVDLTVMGQRAVLDRWVGLASDAALPTDADGLRALAVEFARRVVDAGVVTIDDRPGVPEPVAASAPPEYNDKDGPPYLKVELRYRCGDGPRKVRILWRDCEGADYRGMPEVPISIQHGPDFTFGRFSTVEPEIWWHRPDPRERKVRLEPTAVPPPETTRIPWLSILLLAVAAGAGAGLRRGGLSPALQTGLVAGVIVGAGTAVLAWERVAVEVTAPWDDRVTVPAPEQALTLFETLHRNVYKAFDATTEDEIYDLLAVSVDPALLDDLYGDVYESLILREQGGAVARVKDIEVLDHFVRLPTDLEEWPPSFEVDLTWRVLCQMTHWEHTHTRLNEYRATYTVRFDAKAWKLAGMEVHEQRRVDDEPPPDEDEGTRDR